VNYACHLLTTIFILFLVGCASPKVVVTDVTGKPIPQALIYSISLSMNIGPALMLEERREYHPIFREPVGLKFLRKGTGRYELMYLSHGLSASLWKS